jgi:transposase
MPWRSVKPMEEKIRFIGDYLSKVFNFSELCDRYGISRKSGYKWIERYNEKGAQGLEEETRKPRKSPHKTPEHIEQDILEIRQKHSS